MEAELGMAAAAAEETAALSVRERFARLDPDPAQRLALFNASDRPFDDFVEIEPWLEWTPWQRTWKLVDEKGADVPYQEMASESAGNGQTRLLIPIQLGPSESRILRIVAPRATPVAEAHESPVFNSTPTSLQAVRGYAINLGPQPSVTFPDEGSFSLPQLIAYDDPSDTWSHGLSRYERKNPEAAEWSEPIAEDRGALMESLFQSGSIGRSEIRAEWRLYRDQPWIECRLRVNWAEKTPDFEIRVGSAVRDRPPHRWHHGWMSRTHVGRPGATDAGLDAHDYASRFGSEHCSRCGTGCVRTGLHNQSRGPERLPQPLSWLVMIPIRARIRAGSSATAGNISFAFVSWLGSWILHIWMILPRRGSVRFSRAKSPGE